MSSVSAQIELLKDYWKTMRFQFPDLEIEIKTKKEAGLSKKSTKKPQKKRIKA